MSDQWNDGTDPVVDFSGDSRARKAFKDRAKLSEYGDMDLASGFPAKLIWTAKDGRRIAIPNMTDSHLNNTIAFLRRNASKYRTNLVKQLAGHLVELTLVGMLFDNAPFCGDEAFDESYEALKVQGHQIFQMSDEEILRKFVPQYPHLYQEAYKRKILLEVDQTKISPTEIGRRYKAAKKAKEDDDTALKDADDSLIDPWGDS